jgi:hypothetical protein
MCKRRALKARSDSTAAYITTTSRHNIANLVFLDKSASNERTGHRRRRWSPMGSSCTKLVETKWYTRWPVLLALTINSDLPDPLII